MNSTLHIACATPFLKRHGLPGRLTILLHLIIIPLCIYMLLSVHQSGALAQSTGPDASREAPIGTGSASGVGYVRVGIGNLRSTPTTASEIIGKLKKGDRVELVEKKGEWYRVVASGLRVGWVHEMLIRVVASDSIPKSVRSGKTIFPTDVFVVPIGRVRERPSLDSPIKFRLKEGARVPIIDKRDGWYHIKLGDGRDGWAHHSLFAAAPLPSPTGIKQIKNIHAQLISSGEEKVVFELSGFFTPETFVVVGEKPKVVCDFSGVSLWRDVDHLIPVNGKLIQQITVEPDSRGNPNVRVILALSPENNYHVQPVFYKQNNEYSLIVRPEK